MSWDQIAGILTYIRREWEHTYDPVEPATVAKARAASPLRPTPYTKTCFAETTMSTVSAISRLRSAARTRPRC